MISLPPVKRFESNTGARIYRIACRVFEHMTARVYLLFGAGPPTLVDTGSNFPQSTAHILEGFDAVRRDFGEDFRFGDIGRIIVTHRHPDHLGGLAEFHRLTGAQVCVHPLDKIAVASPRELGALGRRALLDFFRQAGMEESRRQAMLKLSHFGDGDRPAESIAVDLELEDGMELDGLRIIHTPGHSPGHVCIAAGNILLSADHILAQTISQQCPETLGAYHGLGHYLESLDKIQRLGGFETALAAHEQVMTHVSDRIDTIRAAHRRRLERLLGVVRQAARPMSLEEIARELYPAVTGSRAFLAITDVAARVEYLHQRARLNIVNLEEVAQYEQPVFRYGAAP